MANQTPVTQRIAYTTKSCFILVIITKSLFTEGFKF